MVHNRVVHDFWIVPATVSFVASVLLLVTGCHTAASMGLPISAGSNYLLSDAVEIREAIGHRSDVATELAKAPLQPHRVEAGDVLVIEPNDFNSPVQLPSDQTVQQEETLIWAVTDACKLLV